MESRQWAGECMHAVGRSRSSYVNPRSFVTAALLRVLDSQLGKSPQQCHHMLWLQRRTSNAVAPENSMCSG